MIFEIFTIVAPIIFISMLGYAWSYYNLRYDAKFLAKLVMDVGAPCLILATMLKADISSDEVFFMTGITIVAMLSVFVVNTILIKLTKVEFRTYMVPMSFANTGNMGVPICLFAFGEHALALALIFFMVISIVHYSLGVAIMGNQHPLKALVTAPVFYAAMLAFFFVVTGYELPRAIFNTIDLLGGIAIPLMIFSLGVSLQSLHATSAARGLFFGSMRLILGLAIGFLVCWAFDLEGIIRGVVLIQCAMPSAVVNYLMASNFDRQPEEVAGVVVFSTLLSFLTLPFLLYYLLQG